MRDIRSGWMDNVPRLSSSSHRTRSARDDIVALESLATLSRLIEK